MKYLFPSISFEKYIINDISKEIIVIGESHLKPEYQISSDIRPPKLEFVHMYLLKKLFEENYFINLEIHEKYNTNNFLYNMNVSLNSYNIKTFFDNLHNIFDKTNNNYRNKDNSINIRNLTRDQKILLYKIIGIDNRKGVFGSITSRLDNTVYHFILNLIIPYSKMLLKN
jgi:hypothetical protein